MPVGGPVIELVIRMVEGVNEALRNVMRSRGDLSAMVVEALTAVDLVTVAFISAEEPLVLPTKFTLPEPLLARVKIVAQERGTSRNALVNAGLAHWLAAKGAVVLRWRVKSGMSAFEPE